MATYAQAVPTDAGVPEDPATIAALIEQFLTDYPEGKLLEDGRMLFDLRSTQHSLSVEHGRCTLHVWNEQRNLVRRIVSASPKLNGTLRLSTLRMGQSRPQSLELVAARQHHEPSSRDLVRARYVGTLRRVLERSFPDELLDALHAAKDLERSFGPAYARGVLRRGKECCALVSVGRTESQATVDGILTVGLLWLHYCRNQADGRRHFRGVRLIVPAGMGGTTRARVVWLNQRMASYQLFELDERTEELWEIDAADQGNIATRLVDAPDYHRALAPGGRFAEALPSVLALLPPLTHVLGLESDQRGHSADKQPAAALASAHSKTSIAPASGWVAEARLRSPTELSFSVHGLSFAHVRIGYAGQSFNRQVEVTVGAGSEETGLTPDNASEMRDKVHALFGRRHVLGSARDPLYRSSPEGWLASSLRRNITALNPELLADPVYPEVSALTGGGHSLNRGMLDLLAATRAHQLAVIEVKATEDLHLALQGLDYWIRVRHHHLGAIDTSTGLGELQQRGYFPSLRLVAAPPQLILVAPALEIHPATEIVLRYFSPVIPWTLVALDQRWRNQIRPVWRKRHSQAK